VLVLTAQVALLGLSYTQAGVVQAVFTLTSALAQPYFGAYFDHTGKPYLALWSLGSAAVMVTIAGLVDSFILLFIAGAGAGLGIAAFHAAGLSIAKQLGGGRGSGSATAIFLVGGNGGFALGAYMGGVILDRYGAGMLTLPALVVVLFTPFFLRDLKPYLIHEREVVTGRTTRDLVMGGFQVWQPLLVYFTLVLGYQAIQGGMITYLPQYLESSGRSLEQAGSITSIFLLFSAIGSLSGGYLSDYLPRRLLLIGAMLVIAPIGFFLLRADGLLLGILAALLGLATNVSHPILLLMGQDVLPGGQSQAGGAAFAVTFLTRGAMSPFVGAIADSIGLLTTLTLVAIVPTLVALIVFVLPSPMLYQTDK
jgi:FSR family fosmidomycin resistance protein-like MFS transporter